MDEKREERTNRLIHEQSPYLLQHAGNPVDWYPWGDEAFEKARAENKPIFLSVGYSTCHWCHVMEHESFERPEVAEVMNSSFINIKVDREERPDVDRLYMDFVQATTGHGGWPMSVWLTPERKPFAGGTYFPPEDRYGRPGFVTVLRRIAELWEGERDRLEEQADGVMRHLAAEADRAETARPEAIWLETTQAGLARRFDSREGGFSDAPKFPRPSVLDFMRRRAARHAGSERGRETARMVDFTLERMARGGMFDHVGGGFHRYSVDARWHVPHFEKMLYDQAQLVVAYLEAWQAGGDPVHAAVVRDVLGYVARDMTAPDGAFYSAEDADSKESANAPRAVEGAFYVWTREELDRALTATESAAWRLMFGVKDGGNVDPASDPHGELAGKNVLIGTGHAGAVAAELGTRVEDLEGLLRAARKKLFAARVSRPRPHLDNKIIAAWNGMMTSAFVRSGAALGETDFTRRGVRALEWLRRNLWEEGRLYRAFRGRRSTVRGFAADYAAVIRAALDIFEVEGDAEWLEWAVELQTAMDHEFAHPAGGYYESAAGDASLLLRQREDHDGAEPSANSVAADNLLRLAVMTGEESYRDRAERLLESFGPLLRDAGMMLPAMLCAVDRLVAPPRQVVMAGDFSNGDGPALLAAVWRRFDPDRVVLRADGPGGGGKTAGMKPVDGKPTLYVCEDFVCRAPVTRVEEMDSFP